MGREILPIVFGALIGKGRPRFRVKGDAREITWEGLGVEVDPAGSFTELGGESPNLATQWEVLCAGTPAPAVK